MASHAPLGLNASLNGWIEVRRFSLVWVVVCEALHEPVKEVCRRSATFTVEPAILHAAEIVKLRRDAEMIENDDVLLWGGPTFMAGAAQAPLEELTNRHDRTSWGVELLAVYLYWITEGTFRP